MGEFEQAVATGLAKSAEHVADATLMPAAKESGAVLSLIPRTIRAAMLPLEKWVVNREVQLKKLYEAMDEKAKAIPPEKLVSPEPYVAVPALQAASYCMDSEDLRDIFAQLLVTAMNEDTKDTAHPSFVEIIKQMSPLEAKLIKDYGICHRQNAVCQLVEQEISLVPREYRSLSYGKKRMEEARIIRNHVYLPQFSEFDFSIFDINVSLAIDNLIRLGLMNCEYDKISRYDLYELMDSYSLYDSMFEQIGQRISGFYYGNWEHALILGKTTQTELGMAFYRACIASNEP